MAKKSDLPAWCEVIPEVRVSPQEKERVLKDMMKYADGATKKDLQRAIEKIKA